MNTKSTILADGQIATVAGLLLAALLVIPGCATAPNQEWPASTQPSTNSLTLPAMPPPEPVQAGQTPAAAETIVLREGDSIQVTFPGSTSLNTTQTIRRDGKIVMPLIGEVTAAGLTPATLQTNLIQQYAPQISSKEIIVTVTSSTFPVFVTGSVIHPGKVLSDHPLTALDAVMEAGGFDYTKADLKDVRIIRNENGVMKKYSVNLKKIMNGEESKPFYLQPQDIVFVPERLVLF